MKNRPKPIPPWDRVQQIVPRNHHQADYAHGNGGQIDQPGKRDHRPPERPQNKQHDDVIVEIELPTEAAAYDQFKKDQPEASSEEEPRKLSRRLSAAGEERSSAGEQEECRRAEMRDPASEEQGDCSRRRIRGIEACISEEVAGMIERHQDHDHAAQDVDCFQPHTFGRSSLRLCDRWYGQ